MRTVAEPFEAETVAVAPADEPGIRVNGAPATLAAVQKADVRVDLLADGPRPRERTGGAGEADGNGGDEGRDRGDRDGDGRGGGGRGGDGRARRSFVVEHVLGPLGLCGVTAAEVTGVADEWAFERPEHRFCYARGDDPACVVGHPAGVPNPAVVEGVRAVGLCERAPPIRRSVTEPVTASTEGGEVTLRPRERGAGVRFEVSFRGETLTAEVDPAGTTAPDLVDRVVASRTPFLSDDPREGIVHSVADLVSDVAVIGGFEDLVVEAHLTGAYHRATVGAARRARERGVVVER